MGRVSYRGLQQVRRMKWLMEDAKPVARTGKRAALVTVLAALGALLAALGVLPPAVVQPAVEVADAAGELFGLK